MSAPVRVLLAEDEPHLGTILETFLAGRGHAVTRVQDGRAALDAARRSTFDVALLDVVMPEMDGLAVLGALADLPLPPEAVVMTGNGTVDTALQALRLGAYDYLAKPYRMAEVDVLVRRAAEKRALRVAAATHAWAASRRAPVAPASAHPPLREALARAAEAAAAGAPPLVVTGEPGTGRRTAARWLASLASPGRLVISVRATGHPDADAAALFGAREGSAAERAGALGLAAGATLLLADAHRLPAAVAATLDGALASGRYERADGSGSGDLPACVMATAAPGWDAAGDPLAGRLAAAGTLALPALVERVIDITRLAEGLLPPDGAARRLSADASAELAGRAWRGNLAELRCVMALAALHARGELLTAEDLRAAAGPGGAGASAVVALPASAERASLAELERREIAAVLEEVGWHRGRAAARLGISPRTLYRRIREYGFDRPSA